MPPKKAAAAAAAADLDDSTLSLAADETKASTTKGKSAAKKDDDGLGIEDLSLPRSVMNRLARSGLPPNTSIQKDALLAITKAATVFVSYLSAHANDNNPGKRTISPQDVLDVLPALEFDAFVPRIEKELEVFSANLAGKRRGVKAKKDRESGVGVATDGETSMMDTSTVVEDDGERATKRTKRSRADAAVETEGEDGEEDDDGEEEGEEEANEEEEEGADEESQSEEEEGDEEVPEEEREDLVEDLDMDGPGAQLRGELGGDSGDEDSD